MQKYRGPIGQSPKATSRRESASRARPTRSTTVVQDVREATDLRDTRPDRRTSTQPQMAQGLADLLVRPLRQRARLPSGRKPAARPMMAKTRTAGPARA